MLVNNCNVILRLFTCYNCVSMEILSQAAIGDDNPRWRSPEVPNRDYEVRYRSRESEGGAGRVRVEQGE